MFKFTLPLCLVVTSLSVNAQYFKYKANLPAVDSSSFYKVEIPPAVAGKSKPGLVDLRILNKKHSENPYIVKTSAAEFIATDFKQLTIINKSKGADNQTHVVIENAGKQSLQDLFLLIKNTQAQRTVTLSGGEDTTNWYVIKEDLLLENVSGNDVNGSFAQRISFPLVDYRFLKITINGKNVLPVNITAVAVSDEKTSSGKYIRLPPPAITTIDSNDKRSYVYLVFNETYLLDKVELAFSGSKFYKRRVTFYPGRSTSAAPMEFTAASNIPTSFPLEIRAKELLMVVENEDNPPLQINEVRAWQLNKYLLTYLEKGESYSIVFGDSTAPAPAYDLAFFADSIPTTLPVIAPGNIELTPDRRMVKKEEKATRPFVLWIVIFAVLCLLLFACYRLIKDLEKKNRKKDD